MMGVFVALAETTVPIIRVPRRWPTARTYSPIGYVLEESGCWSWVGSRLPNGYGVVTLYDQVHNKKTLYAHRVTYEASKGAIPAGLDLDHLCRNRGCVNPDHLEAVTRRVNLLRGGTITAKNAAKTHCPQGHSYTPENTYRRANGARHCRRCVLAQQKAARVARRGA